MKGIILAGGKNSRLYPTTIATSKQALPIYDKPMIYYPLSILLAMKISEVLIVSSPQNIDYFRRQLGSGQDLGIKIQYGVQNEPRGIADALVIGEEFLAGGSVCLILGDNFFYGKNLDAMLEKVAAKRSVCPARVFGCRVKNPSDFGVVEFDKNTLRVLSIEEKPAVPKSSYAATGLYIYQNSVVEIAKKIAPSPRGELEITAVNAEYLKRGELSLSLLGENTVWFDTGTHDAMLDASNYVRKMQKKLGKLIGCIEEYAYNSGFINKEQLHSAAQKYSNTPYAAYILSL